MTGPYQTREQASETEAVQEVYRAFRADPGVGKMAAHAHRLLMRACTEAGVSLGAFDRRVLAWLSEWEPETAAVIAGLILRAREAGTTPLADRLTALADWIDQRLDDENYDRQAVAESGVTQLRELAALARGGAS